MELKKGEKMTNPEVDRLLEILGHCPKERDIDIDCKGCFSITCDNVEFCDYTQMTTTDQLMRLLYIIKDLPDVVMCKDCKRRGTYQCPVYIGGDGMCSEPDDWFCGDGEHK